MKRTILMAILVGALLGACTPTTNVTMSGGGATQTSDSGNPTTTTNPTPTVAPAP